MAFTDEALKAKLSTLNESQDSIVSVSSWIMFHRRHADRIVTFWLQRLKDTNAQKRLNLLYLVNEIVQNSRTRRKDDFPNAFSPIMPEAAQTTYKSSTTEVQQKIKRLIEVWRQRSVFEVPIQDAIEARLNDIDKSRPAGKKPLMGGSLFGSSTDGTPVPKGLESLVSLQNAVLTNNLSGTSRTAAATAEYTRLNDPNTPDPAPPLHAARISALLKTLATAESSVAESVKARSALVSELEKILETNREARDKDQATLDDLGTRKEAMETRRRTVEDSIRRSAGSSTVDGTLSGSSHGDNQAFTALDPDLERPEYEALTPPPAEALTPLGSPDPFQVKEEPEARNPDIQDLLASMVPSSPAGANGRPGSRQVTVMGGMNGFADSGTAKKRKITHQSGGGELPAGFDLDLDADVTEMIRQESGGGL